MGTDEGFNHSDQEIAFKTRDFPTVTCQNVLFETKIMSV